MPTNALNALRTQRAAYREAVTALPWFDACHCPDDKPAWPEHAHWLTIDSVPIEPASLDAIGTLQRRRTEAGPFLLQYSTSQSGYWEKLDKLFTEMAGNNIPLIIPHTELDLDLLPTISDRYPNLSVIVVSGPDRKILYHTDVIRRFMIRHANLYLCTFNLCNWLGLERLCEDGLESRLLFGTHRPRFSPAAAMASVVFGALPWSTKCAIAGNNLRRLLGIEPVHSPEIPFPIVSPYIVDTHTHCLVSGAPSPLGFSTPDCNFQLSDWIEQMNRLAIERTFLIPLEALLGTTKHPCREYFTPYASEPDRFAYFERFDPRSEQEHLKEVEVSISDPACVGVKIHPPVHQTSADDPSYDPIWKLAQQRQIPIITHSWEISSYNPVQELSHPSRFRRHLERYPGVRLILAHAGGRPSAMEAVTALARQFPNVAVDLAGDYFDNGLVEKLAESVGADRILFGSDVNWINPPSVLGPILASRLSDEDLLKILRLNAAAWYG